MRTYRQLYQAFSLQAQPLLRIQQSFICLIFQHIVIIMEVQITCCHLLFEQNSPVQSVYSRGTQPLFRQWYTLDVNDKTLEQELRDLDYIYGSAITCYMTLSKSQHLFLFYFLIHIYLSTSFRRQAASAGNLLC